MGQADPGRAHPGPDAYSPLLTAPLHVDKGLRVERETAPAVPGYSCFMGATSAGYANLIRRGKKWLAASAVVPRIAAGLVVTGVLAVFPGFLGILIVADDRFIPWWMLGGILLAGALILLRIQAAARRFVREEEVSSWSELQSRWLRVSASVAAVFCVIGMGVDALNSTGYTVGVRKLGRLQTGGTRKHLHPSWQRHHVPGRALRCCISGRQLES